VRLAANAAAPRAAMIRTCDTASCLSEYACAIGSARDAIGDLVCETLSGPDLSQSLATQLWFSFDGFLFFQDNLEGSIEVMPLAEAHFASYPILSAETGGSLSFRLRNAGLLGDNASVVAFVGDKMCGQVSQSAEGSDIWTCAVSPLDQHEWPAAGEFIRLPIEVEIQFANSSHSTVPVRVPDGLEAIFVPPASIGAIVPQTIIANATSSVELLVSDLAPWLRAS